MNRARLSYPPHIALALRFGLAALFCTPAVAQESDIPGNGITGQDQSTTVETLGADSFVGDALATEIARMESEISTIKRFTDWQTDLLRAAQSDPAAALAQRRPMAECLATFLSPICDRLTTVFAPEETPDGAGDMSVPALREENE